MALGILMIVYIFLISMAVIIQFLLYKENTKNTFYVINMLFGMFLSYLTYTSLPTNYNGFKVVAIAFGVIAILGLFVKLKTEKYIIVSKLMLSISIIGGFLLLFL